MITKAKDEKKSTTVKDNVTKLKFPSDAQPKPPHSNSPDRLSRLPNEENDCTTSVNDGNDEIENNLNLKFFMIIFSLL